MKHYISKSYCSIIDLPSWEEVLLNIQNDIEENNNKYNYILDAGDMIYIPKYLYHTPTPLGPRVGISVAFH